MAFVAALATALSVLLMIWAAPAAVSWRLQTVGSGVAGHVREPACGTSVMLSSIIASLQAGAALEPALERAYDSVCAPRVGSGHAHHVRAPTVAGAGHAAGVYAVCDGEGNVDAAQMARLFAACRLPHERASHCTQVACGVAVASAVAWNWGARPRAASKRCAQAICVPVCKTICARMPSRCPNPRRACCSRCRRWWCYGRAARRGSVGHAVRLGTGARHAVLGHDLLCGRTAVDALPACLGRVALWLDSGCGVPRCARRSPPPCIWLGASGLLHVGCASLTGWRACRLRWRGVAMPCSGDCSRYAPAGSRLRRCCCNCLRRRLLRRRDPSGIGVHWRMLRRSMRAGAGACLRRTAARRVLG